LEEKIEVLVHTTRPSSWALLPKAKRLHRKEVFARLRVDNAIVECLDMVQFAKYLREALKNL
jgi:hypothetical protein